MVKFEIYTKEHCPYCTKIKDVLRLTGNTFDERKLGSDFSKQEFYEMFSDDPTFPQVIFNQKSIGGCKDTIKFLKENNFI